MAVAALGNALADAIAYNAIPGDCGDCAANPLGRCEHHSEDADCIHAYSWLARHLGLTGGQ